MFRKITPKLQKRNKKRKKRKKESEEKCTFSNIYMALILLSPIISVRSMPQAHFQKIIIITIKQNKFLNTSHKISCFLAANVSWMGSTECRPTVCSFGASHSWDNAVGNWYTKSVPLSWIAMLLMARDSS